MIQRSYQNLLNYTIKKIFEISTLFQVPAPCVSYGTKETAGRGGPL